jgi:hypothetical protein
MTFFDHIYVLVDSNISIKAFGFLSHESEINGLCKAIKDLSEDDYRKRLDHVKVVREEYTYRGVIRQIDRFFSDPLGPNGGDLVCTRVPHTEKRRVI